MQKKSQRLFLRSTSNRIKRHDLAESSAGRFRRILARRKASATVWVWPRTLRARPSLLAHDSKNDPPTFQEESRMSNDANRSSFQSVSQFGVIAGASALALYGLFRRNKTGLALATAGGLVAYNYKQARSQTQGYKHKDRVA